MKKYLITMLACVLAFNIIAEEKKEENQAPAWPEPDSKALAEWQEMGFGMFIHWGPVSLTGHEIGWSRGKQTPIDVYDKLYKKFNPVKFDADEWARTARDAGMKYMVITTKHHDGFCLWPSEVTDYDIGETPFKRDVLAELSKACRKHGIKFGTYYSVCDWHHPAFPLGSPGGRTKKPNPDLDAYNKYLRAQTEELVKNYGPLVTMWFDVPQVYTYKYGMDMVKKLRELQPDIIINNRAYSDGRKGGFAHQYTVGDYSTPEQRIGGFDRDRPWETCMTICRQWAWKPNDNMKSLKQCLQTLLYTVGGDGNLLFNVGPTSEGIIEERQVKRLKEMGDWLDDYGKCVYKTRGGPFKPGKWGASTCRDNSIFLFVMKWNGDKLCLPPIGVEVKEAKALTGGKVEMSQDDNGIILTMAKDDQKDIATVIELTVDGDALDIEPGSITHRSNSLAHGKKAKASNVYQKQNKTLGPQMALDDNPDTRWATDAGLKSVTLDIDLGKETEIGSVLIDEREWNRVRKFELQRKEGKEWKPIFAGTKIGKDFKKDFPAVKAKEIRLNIMDATDGPTIWELQLFAPKK